MHLKIFFFALILSLYACQSSPDKFFPRSEETNLFLNSPLKSELAKHSADTFKINLKEGVFVYGYADQVSADVVVNIFDPDNKKLKTFDNPSRGPETYQFETKNNGIYKIVVSPFQEDEGSYVMLLLGGERIATEQGARIGQLMKASLGIQSLSDDSQKTPGASIAVARNGSIIYSSSFGYANLEYDIKNEPSTIFHIASISKQFTAFSIALLVDQGRISLEDDVRKYIPELPDFGSAITINHLIHHTSGLRDQWNLLALAGWRLDDVITREQILRMISHQRDLNFLPGEEMVYCNTGFTLLAEIVSRVTGESFSSWTKTNLFYPLGMKHTLFYDDHEKIVKNRAYSYHSDDEGGFKKSVLNYANVGATSLFTTAEDLSLWAMNFQDMKVGNQRVMEMMNQQFVLNNGDTIDYAFGQGKGDYKGLITMSHGGADAGYRSFLVRFPDQQFSVSVLSNLASFDPGDMAYKIADLYLADKLIEDVSQDRQNANLKKDTLITVSPEILESYCGRYELFPGFVITVEQEDNQLKINSPNQPTLVLDAKSENEFQVHDMDRIFFTFQTDTGGEVIQLVFKQNDQETLAKRLPLFDPLLINLHEYVGNYYSPELLTAYKLDIANDTLTAYHQRHDNIKFVPVKEDHFSADTWFMGRVIFTRNEQKEITGFKVSNGRVRNLVFNRE